MMALVGAVFVATVSLQPAAAGAATSQSFEVRGAGVVGGGGSAASTSYSVPLSWFGDPIPPAVSTGPSGVRVVSGPSVTLLPEPGGAWSLFAGVALLTRLRRRRLRDLAPLWAGRIGRPHALRSCLLVTLLGIVALASVSSAQTGAACVDNRVSSSDDATARLRLPSVLPPPGANCTAWLIPNGAVLTAGHCVDQDQDGQVDAQFSGAYIEFNVPDSAADGSYVDAAPEDRYDVGEVVAFEFLGPNSARDWAVLRALPNAVTGRSAHQVQGFYRPVRSTPAWPAQLAPIWVHGYGDEPFDPTQSRTLQVSPGTFNTEQVVGAGVWHVYFAYTGVGVSGGPLSSLAGYAIGIHTNGGCEWLHVPPDPPVQVTVGKATSFNHTLLRDAVNDFAGVGAVHVDAGAWSPAPESGTAFSPFTSLAAGVAAVPAGGTIVLTRGTYNATLLEDPMVLEAPTGGVVIEP